MTNEPPAQVPAVVAAWNANNKFVQDNLHEIRLQFRWLILPNGSTPPHEPDDLPDDRQWSIAAGSTIRVGANRVQIYSTRSLSPSDMRIHRHHPQNPSHEW